MTELIVVIAVLAVSAVVGLMWRSRQGRVRGTPGRSDSSLPQMVREQLAPEGLTLVMLSSPVCARCPQVRKILDEVVAEQPGLTRIVLDLVEHDELPDALGVRSTPTTIAFDWTGHELFRVVGVPRRAELLDGIAAQRRSASGTVTKCPPYRPG